METENIISSRKNKLEISILNEEKNKERNPDKLIQIPNTSTVFLWVLKNHFGKKRHRFYAGCEMSCTIGNEGMIYKDASDRKRWPVAIHRPVTKLPLNDHSLT